MERLLRNLLSGASTILLLTPHPYVASISRDDETDEDALRRDWEQIGDDFRQAIKTWETRANNLPSSDPSDQVAAS